jgi:hypothetical protein
MTLLLLHGTFVDEFLIEIVLPLTIFFGLYKWSSRKEKRKRAAADQAPAADAAAGRGENRAPAADAAAGRGEK